uniref:Uncharacterized protein n=1 Tax=Globisporangium ultimum (strain ATCC 200006 / CBS 805.95 / DAOM BR144) TaxID=431595 RepID=K3WHE5_GLOUD
MEDALVVVVPERATGAASEGSLTETAALTLEQVEMVVKRDLDARDQRRTEYSIPKCPTAKEMELLQRLGLRRVPIEVNEVQDDSIAGYQWSENASEQRDALPFSVKEAADLIIVDALAKRMRDAFADLGFVIEVKKDAASYDERAIAVDPPVGLLTDLNGYWYFLWFTPDKKVNRMVLTCPANGFKMMHEILAEASGASSDDCFPMQVSFLESPPRPLRRQKLIGTVPVSNNGAEEILERYLLMSDELSPEFLLDRMMEYMHRLISQMPIYSHMYN